MYSAFLRYKAASEPMPSPQRRDLRFRHATPLVIQTTGDGVTSQPPIYASRGQADRPLVPLPFERICRASYQSAASCPSAGLPGACLTLRRGVCLR